MRAGHYIPQRIALQRIRRFSAIQTLEGAEAGGWSSGGRGKGFDEANNELGQKGGSSVTRMLLSRDARANKFARQKKAPPFA